MQGGGMYGICKGAKVEAEEKGRPVEKGKKR